MKYYVEFRQQDPDGKLHEFTESFPNQKARQSFIEQLRFSARSLGLPFNVLREWEAPY